MKYIKLLIISIFVFFISISVSASTKTYTRTKDKLLIPSKVKVTSANVDEILKTPAIASKEKIYDFANVYSEEEEKKLYDKVVEYMNLTDIDLAIVTTRDLNGIKDVEKYSYNFYKYNSFKEEGVILVIYINQYSFDLYMNVLGNDDSFKEIYTKKNINDSLAYISTFFVNNYYYTGTDKYIGLLKGYYKRAGGRSNRKVAKNTSISEKSIPLMEIIILTITLTFVIIMLLYYRLKSNNKLGEKDILNSKIDSTTLMVNLDKDEEING